MCQDFFVTTVSFVSVLIPKRDDAAVLLRCGSCPAWGRLARPGARGRRRLEGSRNAPQRNNIRKAQRAPGIVRVAEHTRSASGQSSRHSNINVTVMHTKLRTEPRAVTPPSVADRRGGGREHIRVRT